MTTANNVKYLDVITYAVSAGITSTVAVGQRASVGLANVLSAAAEELGQNLSYRVVLGDPLQADDIIIETVIDGVIFPFDFTGGFAQVDDVVANTTLPTFITFNKKGTYIFTIELIETNSTNVLAKDIEIAQAVSVF